MVRNILEADYQRLNEIIAKWGSRFDFKIEDNYLIVNRENIAEFIDYLDKEFDKWDENKDKKKKN